MKGVRLLPVSGPRCPVFTLKENHYEGSFAVITAPIASEAMLKTVEMEPRVEIQPDRFAVVVGPQFAIQVLQEMLDSIGAQSEQVTPPTFKFKSIVDRGVSYLLEKESLADDIARAKFEARYSNAYELDPTFVLRKISNSLRAAGYYREWLAELFECHIPAGGTSASLERLLALQRRGTLLIYLHCDEIVTRAAGLNPVVLDDAAVLERWIAGECPGFLQPHGVYSRPESVRLDGQMYDDTPGHLLSAAIERLKSELSCRSIILLGEEWSATSENPLISNFCKRFVTNELRNEIDGDTVVFNTTGKRVHDFISLPVSQSNNPLPSLHPMAPGVSDLWKQVNIAPSGGNQYKWVCLLVSSQIGARDISHTMFNAPGGVNFALVNPVTYQSTPAYSVLLRVSSAGLQELWHWLLTDSLETLISSGLTGLAVSGGAFLWLTDPDAFAQGHSRSGTEEFRNQQTTYNPVVSRAHSPNLQSPPTHQSNGNSTQFSSLQMRADRNDHLHQRQGKIIQRYKVVKKRNGQLGSDVYRGMLASKTSEDPGPVFSFTSPFVESNSIKYARRGSLPPIKCGEPGNTLALFAERLQSLSPDGTSTQIPSYVAIKRALLSDKFKQGNSPISKLVAPKTLLNLLQNKKAVETREDKSTLVSYRRNSDPGSYLHHRDKTRRRQLFFDENVQWIKTYGSIIDQKIQSWRQKRLLRKQKEYLLKQQQQQQQQQWESVQGLCQLQSEYPKLVQGPLFASLASASIPTSHTALSHTFVTAPAPGINGLSQTPLMYPIQSGGLAAASVIVPTPFVSPYAFMSGLPTTAHTANTAYIMPPSALAAAVGGAQTGMMLLPNNITTTSGSHVMPSTFTADTKPPLRNLLGPALTVKSPPVMDTKPEKLSPEHPSTESFIGSRKRKSSFPEKLSSLLQPPSDPDIPNGKRCCTDSNGHTISSISPPPPPLSTSSLITSLHELHSHSTTSHMYTHNSSHHHTHHHRHHHKHKHHHNHHNTPSSPHAYHINPHKPPSPLEQCLLQSPASPGSDGGRMTDSACESSASSPASSSDYSRPPSPQLWQFLLDLLMTTNSNHLIQWNNCTDEEYEFTIHRPAEVAQLWGKCTKNSAMNYDKLARGLRYYYSKGIIEKVEGKKLTFRYNGLARSYVQQRCREAVEVTNSVEEMVIVE